MGRRGWLGPGGRVISGTFKLGLERGGFGEEGEGSLVIWRLRGVGCWKLRRWTLDEQYDTRP